MKSGAYEQALKDLQAKGVVLAQRSNTVRERKIDKNDLFPCRAETGEEAN